MAEEKEEKQQSAVKENLDEVNVFKRLLYGKDDLYTVRVRTPFLPQPLIVHYMRLGAGEEPKLDIPDDFDKIELADRAKILTKWNATIAWAMIKKANKSGKVAEEYVLDSKTWNEIKKSFPSIHDDIVAKVTGAFSEMLDFFIGGGKSQS